MKKFKLKGRKGNYWIIRLSYTDKGRPCYEVYGDSEGYDECYDRLSVNLDETPSVGFWTKGHEGMDFINRLVKEEILYLTGEEKQVGFGTYVAVDFTGKGKLLINDEIE